MEMTDWVLLLTDFCSNFSLMLLTEKNWGCNSVQNQNHNCCNALCKKKADPLDTEVVSY